MPRPVLADTSIWADFLREGSGELSLLLAEDQVVIHSAIIGELACGNLRRRPEVIGRLQRLPQVLEASPQDALGFLDRHKLYGTGLGWVDVQLLASAALSGARLLTGDLRLARAAAGLKLA